MIVWNSLIQFLVPITWFILLFPYCTRIYQVLIWVSKASLAINLHFLRDLSLNQGGLPETFNVMKYYAKLKVAIQTQCYAMFQFNYRSVDHYLLSSEINCKSEFSPGHYCLMFSSHQSKALGVLCQYLIRLAYSKALKALKLVREDESIGLLKP